MYKIHAFISFFLFFLSSCFRTALADRAFPNLNFKEIDYILSWVQIIFKGICYDVLSTHTHTFMFTYRPTDTQHIIKRERFLINMILTYRRGVLRDTVFLSIKCNAAVYSSFIECGTQRICN